MRARTVAVLLATLLGGCGGVLSKNPASDEATTADDARLVGFWRIDAVASCVEDDAARDEMMFVVGRRAAPDRTLELLGVSLKKDGVLDADRYELRPTRIDGRGYASLRNPLGVGPEAKNPESWAIMRYEMPDGDTLRVLSMEEKTVAADVRAGKILGTVSESKEPPGAEPTLTVGLTASTTALRAYLEQRGDGVFRSEKPLVLRRLRLK